MGRKKEVRAEWDRDDLHLEWDGENIELRRSYPTDDDDLFTLSAMEIKWLYVFVQIHAREIQEASVAEFNHKWPQDKI